MKKQFFSAMLFLYTSIAFSQVYVNHAATGTNDGSSWANAYTSLTIAIANAQNGNEFWVAQGNYYVPASAVSTGFIINKEIEIYGGFTGTEIQRAQRNYKTNKTVFSGDVQQNDDLSNFPFAENDPTRTDNSGTVIRIRANNIVLDGVTVSSGHSTGNWSGIVADATITAFTVINSEIAYNYSKGLSAGVGATTNVASTYVINNNHFHHNSSSAGTGFFFDHIGNNTTLNVEIANNLFNTNRIATASTGNTYSGSAGWIRSRNFSITHLTFTNNTVVNNYSDDPSSSSISNVTFGLSRTLYSTLNTEFHNNIFWGNTGATTAPEAVGKVDATDVGVMTISQHNISEDGEITNVTVPSANPLFTNSTNGDFTLQASSPAVDAGNNTYIPNGVTTDLAGNNRIHNTTVDIGAYEHGATAVSGCTNIVTIPDANFKAALVANTNINTDGDSEICTTEATAFTGTISVSSRNILDLTGIQAFTNLTGLDCSNNSLTSLDISSNTNLTQLNCNNNALTTLNTNGANSLARLFCFGNQLASLNLSNNTALIRVDCYDNNLASLNVSNNTNLVELYCYRNLITILNLPTGTALAVLRCDDNQLASLDVSTSTSLTTLFCMDNQLTSLDVSTNTVLEELNCSDNQLTSLTLPTSTTFNTLVCTNNQLTSLDVSGATALESLGCFNNQLTSLNVSVNTALQGLSCGMNQLVSLNVSTNTALRSLNCRTNQLTSLNVSTNIALSSLICSENQLTSLDVSGNSSLDFLSCATNQLTSLNIANGNNSGMIDMYANANPNLTCINIDANGTPGGYWSKDNTANYSDDCQYTTFWSKATTGVTSDWATASNWTNGLPDQSYAGVIPAGANVYPVITIDASTSPIGNLTIENGASLYIDPAGSLAADTVTNNGTFSIASNATDSGTFEATTVVGDITYQRYATTRWHLIGSPVSGQDIDVFVGSSQNDLAANSTTNAKAFAVYDNTQAQASDYWQYYQSAANSAMVNAKGYAVKRKSLALSGTLQFEGTYNHGNVTYTGTGSTNNKFEMVSNPYTRYLDLNNFLNSNTSNMSATNAALYFWNDAQNRYDVYNSSSAGNQYVAPGQGFFVEMANTGGSFTFRPNMTTHNATGALLRTAPQTEVLISIAEGKTQKTTQIKYLANTGKGLDVGYDAGYFDGHQSNVGIYTKLADGTYNDTNFMLQCVGKDLAEETVIPLGIKTDVARTVTFTAEAMNLPDNLKVFLEDTQTGSVTELSNGGSYEATVNAGSGRFFLHTKESARLSTNNVALEGINIFKQGNNLQVKGVQEASRVVLYNLQGKEVLNAQVTSSQSLVALPKLATGMYIVNVSNSNGSTSKKVIF